MTIYKTINKNRYYFILRETETKRYGCGVYYNDSLNRRYREIHISAVDLEVLADEKIFQKIDIFKVLFNESLKRRILKTILISPFFSYELIPKLGKEKTVAEKFVEEIGIMEVDSKNSLKQVIEEWQEMIAKNSRR